MKGIEQAEGRGLEVSSDQRLAACLVSQSDVNGGAARASWRLFEGLRRAGHGVKMLVQRKTVDDPDVLPFRPGTDFRARLERKVRRTLTEWEMRRSPRRRGVPYEIFTPTRSPEGVAVGRAMPECDVANLHWVAGFVDEDGLREIVQRTPVVWTLHDQHALTGGCHYDEGCGRFRKSCGGCPQLGSESWGDAAYRGWARRRSVFSALSTARLVFVTPSRWLAECVASCGSTSRFRVEVVENGLDLEEFSPRDPQIARTVLGLSEREKVICFAGGGTWYRRKGLEVLTEALALIPRERRPTLLLLGAMPEARRMDCRVVAPGVVSMDRWLSFLYSAADLTVVPSHQDNLPNVILESLACGTPVVGARCGGIPEAVADERVGRLFAAGSPHGLASVLEETLNAGSAALEGMRRCARERALVEYGVGRQARRYAALFRSVREGAR